MINFEEYTKNTYSHVPERYQENVSVLVQIYDKNKGDIVSCMLDAWKLGFERACRAAKAGKLNF